MQQIDTANNEMQQISIVGNQQRSAAYDGYGDRMPMMMSNLKDMGAPPSKSNSNKEGFDLARLVHPQIDHINEDFLCVIC